MYLTVIQKENSEAQKKTSYVELTTINSDITSTMLTMWNLTKKKLLLLLAVCLPHIVSAQNTYISHEIKPYVEFIESFHTSPVDYIMGLFEKYDVVVLGERDHRDTTQYTMIRQIVSDPRFIDKVGNILTEVGVYHKRDELNKVLQANYRNNTDFNKALAEVNFNLQWLPVWEKTNWIQFQKDIYHINRKLPANKKINVYPTDVQFSWEYNKNITAKEFKRFFNSLEHRDLIMGNNAVDALCKIFAGPRKKALIIYNTPHSCRFYENTHDANFFAYQVIADRFPGRVANVAINWAVTDYNQPYPGLTNGGKWDAAFAACGNKSVGFDLSGTIFGADTFDIFTEYAAKQIYQDVYHGFIFYKPASEWINSGGIPIFCNLDKSYVKNEIARRFLIFQGMSESEMTEELKEALYDDVTKLNVSNIFEGESLQMINEQIELYYKP